MRTAILNKLNAIEKEHDVKILFSCESGSRGWGFPSPDSDFDARFIYLRPLSFYLSVSENADHLSFPINDELDIYGWDLKKVLQLMRKSNTTPFEWLQSPIVYWERGNFRSELWGLCPGFFNRRSNVHHYLGIAKNAMDTIINGQEIKIKKLFYVLRPLLSAKWCLGKKEIAPMTIGALSSLLPSDLQMAIEELVAFKSTVTEGRVVKIGERLKSFIDEEFKNCSAALKDEKKDHFEASLLDEFFIKMINEYDC